MNIICDLDGTIALDHGRAHFLHPIETRDWDAYFEACHTDQPSLPTIEVLKALAPWHKIFILTGRKATVHEKTVEWLKKYQVPWNSLQMRNVNDRTDDHILKEQWASQLNLTPSNTLFVMEDRQRVVDMWRAKGFRCFQVAPGNF